MEIQEVLEYAQLAQQCYHIPTSAYHLPHNWQIVFAPEVQGNWNTFYALYANKVKNEVILAIRGTDKVFNILTDLGLVISAVTGSYQRPPHQDRVENVARHVSDWSSISNDDLEELGRRLRNFDNTVGNEIKGWMIALTYIAAIAAGLCAANSFASSNNIIGTIISGTIILGISVGSLISLRDDTFRRLVDRLESPELREPMNNLEKSVQHFKDKNFPGFKLKIVGHSLGAVMAELCAVKIGVECISFESPGTSKLLDTLSEYRGRQQNIVNFLSAPNIINTLNSHSGNIFRLKLPHTIESFSFSHGANCVLGSAGRLLAYGSVFFGGAVFLGALGAGALCYIPALWSNKTWLSSQHSIDNIVIYLRQGNPQQIKMKSWPDIFWERKRNVIYNSLRCVLPLQKDKPGLRNLLDEEGMREAQIKRMHGYIEYEESDLELFEWIEIDGNLRYR